MPIELLQTNKLMPRIETALAERFTVHRLFDAADREALLSQVGPSIRAIAGHSADAALIARLPGLEIIANFGVGYDGVDVAAARQHKVRVTNTPDVLNDAVAEIAIGLLIAVTRRIPQADRFTREGRWAKGSFGFQAEMNGKTLGILGLGRIGKEIAARAQAMKLRVVYHGRRRQPDEPHVYYSSLADMARDSDYLLIIAPGGKGTDGIVSREVLAALGPKGYLVNMARGSLVDEAALIEALGNGGIAGAALDVFDKEPNVNPALFAFDNVVLSPHQGSATHQTRNKMADLLVANLDAHFAGNPLPSAVA